MNEIERIARLLHDKATQWCDEHSRGHLMDKTFDELREPTQDRYRYVAEAVLNDLLPIAEEMATHDIGGES